MSTTDPVIKTALKLETAGSFLSDPMPATLTALERIFNLQNPEHKALYDAVAKKLEAKRELDFLLRQYL